jgi:hypothetical protein
MIQDPEERGTGRVSADELKSPSANPLSQTMTIREQVNVTSSKAEN